MSRKIAVAFIHGIEIDDHHHADTAIRLLKRRFAGADTNPDDALVIRAAYWSDVVRTAEKKLLYGRPQLERRGVVRCPPLARHEAERGASRRV